MARVISLFVDAAAQIGENPRRVKCITLDNLATVTTAAWINPALLIQGVSLLPTDIIDMIYSYNAQTNSGTFGEFTVAIANGVVTLSQSVSGGNVVLPVVSGNLAAFSGTSGAIADSGIVASNVVLKTGTQTMAAGSRFVLAKVNGTEAANAVTTVNGNAGVITTSALTTAAGASYAITWTNTAIATTSSIQLTLMGGTNTVNSVQLKATAGAGTSTLTIYNIGPTDPLDGTILIGYIIL